MTQTKGFLAACFTALAFVSTPHLAPEAQALTIDFEFGAHQDPLPEEQYLDLGVRIIGMAIFVPPAGGWDSVHSGTRGGYPSNDTSLDGTPAISIASEHGLTPSQFAKVSDVVFVVPGTTIPGTVDAVSVWIGFDENAGVGEGNRMIIEAFDVNGIRVVDFTSERLVGVANQLHEFNAPGIARLRITHVDWVGVDDLSFETPVVSVPLRSFPAILVLAVLLCSIAAHQWKLSSLGKQTVYKRLQRTSG